MGRIIEKLRACCICCGKRKFEKNENQYDITSEQGIENKAFEKEKTIEKTRTSDKVSNVIQFVDFLENMKDMERFDEISKEFHEMKSSIRFEPGAISQLPVNRGKNRFMNILPNEQTRVKLVGNGNEFINANRVNFSNGRKYIATQAPLPGTKEDFWFMVWQEKVNLIVMLTNLVENAKTKSDHYWPYDSIKEDAFDGVSIEMSEELIQTHWTERTFYLSTDTETRKVRQIQLTTWAEREVPDDVNFFNFVRHVKEEQLNSDSPAGDEVPVLVHCSDGSLRTGLYICLDQLVYSFEKESYFDILGMVYRAKVSRNYIIQHESQYKFLYEFVRNNLSGKYNDTTEATDHFERLPSTEIVEDDVEPKKMAYFNPALDDDSSSASSSSFTDTDEGQETVVHVPPKYSSSSAATEPAKMAPIIGPALASTSSSDDY